MNNSSFEYNLVIDLPEQLAYWNKLKGESEIFAERLRINNYFEYAEKVENCCNKLNFQQFKGRFIRLKDAQFCRVRGCTICEWRRSLKNASIVSKNYKKIIQEYPKIVPLLVELPVPNLIAVSQLKAELTLVNTALRRFTELRVWKSKYNAFFRTLTFANNYIKINCYVLAFMPSSFLGSSYISQKQITENWQQSLRIKDRSLASCDSKVIKNKEDTKTGKIYTVSSQIMAVTKKCSKLNLKTCSDASLSIAISQVYKIKLFTSSMGFTEVIVDSSDESRKS